MDKLDADLRQIASQHNEAVASQKRTLEEACERAIRRAAHERQWPARVGMFRMSIEPEAIEATIRTLEAAGWRIQQPAFRSDCLLEIDRPGSASAR